MTREEILRAIDEITAPEKMSRDEAVEWLDDLIAELEDRVDALEEEIATGDES